MNSKLLHHPITHVLLIAGLGILAYSNSFGVPFILDDLESIVQNETIRSLAGHVSHQMLKHYSHIGMEAKRRAVEALGRKRLSEPEVPTKVPTEAMPGNRVPTKVPTVERVN